MATPINTDQTIKLILNFVKSKISIFSIPDRRVILKETIKHLRKLLDDLDGTDKVYKAYTPPQE